MKSITTQHFVFSDLQHHPQLVIDLLAQKPEIAFVVKREGDDITVSAYPVYRQEVNAILAEAQAEQQRLKQDGYDRQQAFQGWRESQAEISKYL